MKVLLVEDYHDTRRLMRMFLEQQGCVVVAAIAEIVAQTPGVDGQVGGVKKGGEK